MTEEQKQKLTEELVGKTHEELVNMVIDQKNFIENLNLSVNHYMNLLNKREETLRVISGIINLSKD